MGELGPPWLPGRPTEPLKSHFERKERFECLLAQYELHCGPNGFVSGAPSGAPIKASHTDGASRRRLTSCHRLAPKAVLCEEVRKSVHHLFRQIFATHLAFESKIVPGAIHFH
jgi:hypothetical protein